MRPVNKAYIGKYDKTQIFTFLQYTPCFKCIGRNNEKKYVIYGMVYL
jgi:hypothetical protein